MEPPLPPLAQERTFRFLGAYAVVLGVLQLLCIVTGLLRVVMSQPLAILVVAASVAAGWRYAFWLRPAQAQPATPRPRRLEVGLAVAVFALVVIAAVLISDSTSPTVVHYQKIIANDFQSAIKQVQDLINKYTK